MPDPGVVGSDQTALDPQREPVRPPQPQEVRRYRRYLPQHHLPSLSISLSLSLIGGVGGGGGVSGGAYIYRERVSVEKMLGEGVLRCY